MDLIIVIQLWSSLFPTLFHCEAYVQSTPHPSSFFSYSLNNWLLCYFLDSASWSQSGFTSLFLQWFPSESLGLILQRSAVEWPVESTHCNHWRKEKMERKEFGKQLKSVIFTATRIGAQTTRMFFFILFFVLHTHLSLFSDRVFGTFFHPYYTVTQSMSTFTAGIQSTWADYCWVGVEWVSFSSSSSLFFFLTRLVFKQMHVRQSFE